MKKSILYILLDSVFLAVFNTVFFVIAGTDHSVPVWMSYGFIHFAYLMVIATPILTHKSRSASVFGISLFSVSTVYFFVEFVVGLFFILIGGKSYKAALVLQVIIAGIYAVALLSNLIANAHTADSEKRRDEEAAFLQSAASRVKLLIGKRADKKANKKIERAYDVLHASPTRSNALVKAIEADILEKIGDLELAVSNGSDAAVIDRAEEIIALVEERNQKLKQNNP